MGSTSRIGGADARRVTVSIPEELVVGLDSEVAAGAARSRTDLINDAIARELRRLRRAAIDAEILEAAADPAFTASDNALASAFESADRETWKAIEQLDGGYFVEPR